MAVMYAVLPPRRQVMLAYVLNNLAFNFKRALNCAALSNAAAASAALGKPGCALSPSRRARRPLQSADDGVGSLSRQFERNGGRMAATMGCLHMLIAQHRFLHRL
jgi:hypothetical protein